MSGIDTTLAERGARYGEFDGHAHITQGLKDVMANSPSSNWAKLRRDQKEALEMVVHKIGRILNGDPDYIDSWTDIIGYARLVETDLIRREAANQPERQPEAQSPKEDIFYETGTPIGMLLIDETVLASFLKAPR
ncbi:hypothetical protein [Herminiimonas sp. CN]|uniref:hypothetical protein n=1 Tax=Herminiimonas sp. CN TaxID=1349818 RepID=UPI000473A18C|nr:hypothetical protein [Herminiimonas sp. CN]